MIAGHTTANVSIGLDTEISTSAIFNHDGSDTDYRQQLGHGSTLGIGYQAGPHRLTTGYSYNYRRTVINGDDRSLTWNGSTRYLYQPGPRFDLNAGHSIRAVAPQEDFLLDITGYETRSTLGAGGGVNFFPSSRSRLRFDVQGTQVLDNELDPDGRQLRVGANGTQRLARRQTGGVSLSRSLQWNRDDDLASTLDTLQLTHSWQLEQGSLNSSFGVSLFEAGNQSRLIWSGGTSRRWTSQDTSTTLSYQRQIVDNISELAFDVLVLPEDPEDLPENIEDLDTETIVIEQQQGLIRDSVSLSRQTGRLCDRCTVQWDGIVTRREQAFSEVTDWQYGAGTQFGLRITSLQQGSVSLRYQASSDDLFSDIDEEQYRARLSWQRQLSERARLSSSAEHSWRTDSDNSRTVLQASLRYGLINR